MPYTLSKTSDEVLPGELTGSEISENRWTLNFGPQHPATHTTLRLVLELDGERIVKVTPHIGYLHSGFEKCGEALNYNQYVTIVDRMDYSAPIYNELAWHGAVEKLLGIELTPRTKVLRTIAGELGRIQSHLLCVGAAGLDLGAFTAFLYGFNERERIYDIVEYMSGQRFHTSWTRVGGLNQDLPDEAVFKRMVKKFIDENMPRAMEDVAKLLNKNRIFIDRTKGIGEISREEAIAWSLSGPMARSAGVKRDIRKDEPYLCFANNWDGQGSSAIDFKVPIMTTGDVYARYLVRLEEMKQSLDIIRKLIDDIPGGPVNVSPEGKDVLPPKEQVYSSIEGLIQHFELIMTNRGFECPKGEVYNAIETANGEQGFYVVSDGGNRPWRCRTRPPVFINYSVFPKLLEGHMISDVVAVLGSINVIAAELDR
ncbi:NADH-quinone oxidoreductase subunit D [Humisphaera borealis]|uniref:NADH-quinone oxidoreductase subunit D n=1 Tax=Humisphaera borealis TaxID=2807512 RepID=A0A7M2WQV0_9BACT|nr:NADH-quinone oxidoreductase subunit D [Humisphaera borealis]QOV87542.1 NADH-quinone oxidoreductase subunit D [Humisphaera borealis]